MSFFIHPRLRRIFRPHKILLCTHAVSCVLASAAQLTIHLYSAYTFIDPALIWSISTFVIWPEQFFRLQCHVSVAALHFPTNRLGLYSSHSQIV